MKKVLVTGASKGIGQAITDNLLKQNFVVYGTSRHPQTLAFKQSNFVPLKLDLHQIANHEDAVADLVQQCAGIDAIIFNAGEGQFAGLDEFSHKQINQYLSINLLAHIHLAKAFLNPFKRRGSGDFIFIGSESALSGAKFGTIYCAAKFGLRGFTQSLRAECTSNNIRVGLINPGMVSSSFFDDLSFGPGSDEANSIFPEQVADAVNLMLNSNTNVVWDEINLSPLKKVVERKKNY